LSRSGTPSSTLRNPVTRALIMAASWLPRCLALAEPAIL
jgi:hypothetical protein